MLKFIDVAPENQAIEADALAEIKALIASGEYINTSHVVQFEQAFAARHHAPYGISVNSGTDALYLSLLAVGVKPGDEVVTVSLTFPATTMAILKAGAIPVLVDVDDTLCMDPARLEADITPKTAAIVPVHYTGRIANMDAIMAIANQHGVPVIEDAAQAVLATRDDQFAGAWGKTACFSFFPTKNLSCLGDGGLVLTHDQTIADKLVGLRNFGRTDREQFKTVGFNSRLDGIQAIFLMEKLKRIDKWFQDRCRLAAIYDEKLGGHYEVPISRPNEVQAYHLYVCRTKGVDNMDLLNQAKEQGIDLRIHYRRPTHLQPFLQTVSHRLSDLSNTERFRKQMLSLPIYPSMPEHDCLQICEFLIEVE